MAKFNFNKSFLNLDGEQVLDIRRDDDGEIISKNPITLNKQLANLLAQDSKGDYIKHMDWARTLNRGELLDIDRSDQEYLKNWIHKHPNITAIFEEQLMNVFLEKKMKSEESNGVKEMAEETQNEN